MNSPKSHQLTAPLSSATFAFALAAVVTSAAFVAPASAADTQQLQAEVDNLQKQIDDLKTKSAAAPASFTMPSPIAADGTLTMYGVTLYGTVDLGVGFQSHGAALNDYFGPGVEYLLQKSAHGNNFSLAPNGMSQSNVGIKGTEELYNGVSAVFKAEVQFNPQSGQIGDHLKALTENNSLGLNQQTSNADSSRAGETFQNAYIGLSHNQMGTLTIGRQNSLILDNIYVYDPMGGSQAFSLIGFSGTYAGGGDTEDARLDSAVKYRNQIGPVRIAILGQLDGISHTTTTAEQGDLGFDYAGFSLDATYSFIRNAVSASSYGGSSMASVAAYPNDNVLKGTISNNTAMAAMAKYKYGPATAFAGYEHIMYGDPSASSTAAYPLGTSILSGYVLGSVTLNKYANNEVLQVMWVGGKYDVTSELTLATGWYHLMQNNYAGVGSNGTCSTSAAGTCSGYEDVLSGMADYTFNKHFDVYAGTMYSHVNGGVANGYLHNNTVSPTLGARVKF